MSEKLEIYISAPISLSSKSALILKSPQWTSRLRSLMYELVPCVYHQDEGFYEATTVDLDYLKLRCKDMHVEFEIVDTLIKNSAPDEMSSVFRFKTKPFSHQAEALNFGMNHDKFLLADEMGCGKSKECIDIAVKKKIDLGYKHCLIICGVNGLKWNWESEIKVHSDEKCIILGNRQNSRGKWNVKSSAEKLYDAQHIPDDVYFIITNVESLRNKDIAKALKKQCDNGTISMIAFDEFHMVTTPDAQQSKGLLKLNADSMIAMTGSPIMNSPLDIYMTLRWLGYDRHCFSDFKNQFCRFGAFNEIVGFKNMNQIQDLLKFMMLRRRKDDVLDLPDKIHKVEFVDMDTEQIKVYNEVLNGIREDVDLIARSKNPLANLIRLRQATGHTSIISSTVSKSAKIDRLKQLVKEITDNDKKCIIFSNWTKITDIVERELSEYNPAVITGNTRERVEQQNKFMSDDTCKCLIGTIAAAGTGLTLTAATTVIFLDEPWTAARKDQAEDRAHRIGAKEPVTIITLVAKNTIDEKIHQIVEEKRFTSEAMIDNLSFADITSLLNFLVA